MNNPFYNPARNLFAFGSSFSPSTSSPRPIQASASYWANVRASESQMRAAYYRNQAEMYRAELEKQKTELEKQKTELEKQKTETKKYKAELEKYKAYEDIQGNIAKRRSEIDLMLTRISQGNGHKDYSQRITALENAIARDTKKMGHSIFP